MITSRRSATRALATATATAAMFVGLLLPSAALAKPSDEACAAYRAIPFSTPVPDAMRTAGTHRFEWYSTFDNADGTTGDALAQNQIKIMPGTPLYPNNVLLRLFRNTTLLADGEVVTIDEMAPTQPATLYAAAYSFKGDDPFLSSFRTWIRYETSRNHWSAWTELSRGPATNFCNQVTNSMWKKTFGWD